MEMVDFRFWAGTEESFNAYLHAMKAAAGLDIKAYAGMDDGEDTQPRLLTKQGNVGVVSVRGPLVPSAPWYAKYVGMTGYDEIRQALVAAANDPEIGAILLDVNSGGGAVAGVTDVAELISNIDAKVKPVQTFSDGMIASAALWIGSSGRSLQIGKVTEAGSIGVLTVHKEMTKALEQAGITATVLRSAEYKALGNPMEPLSDKAKTEILGQLKHLDAMFNAHMADSRGYTEDMAREKFGNGRVFIGQQAVDVGLVDAVSNFDSVVSAIQGAIDSEKQRSQYGGNFVKGPGVKHALTEQHVAALAEGLAIGAATTPSEAQAVASEPAQAAQASETPVNEAGDGSAPAPAPAQASQGNSEVVAYLQGQLAEAQGKLVDLTIKFRDLEASAQAAQGAMATMRSIVVASVDRLQVALGQTPGASASLDDAALLAMHTALRADFEKKFKAGGVAAVSSSAAAEAKSEVVDSVLIRRRKATQPA